MFCSQCGAQAEGNFCWSCGSRLKPAAPASVERRDEPVADCVVLAEVVADARPAPPPPPPAAAVWHDEHRYQVLLHFPEVRDLLAQYSGMSRAGMTGEQFIALCDKAFEPMVGVSLKTISAIAMPINERLGIRTGKSRGEFVARPVGLALVAALCSLARHGRELKRVEQLADGCAVTAVLPSDMRTMTGGELCFTVRRQSAGARVEAATKIPGQLYDWGKSAETLDQLFDDFANLLAPYASPPSLRPNRVA